MFSVSSELVKEMGTGSEPTPVSPENTVSGEVPVSILHEHFFVSPLQGAIARQFTSINESTSLKGASEKRNDS
jgi:hypothetical protein